MTIRTHYDNLKVTRDAPVSVIKAAYRALCQNYHPDKFQGCPEEAERVIKLVNASYAVLIDPVKRAGHNVWIRDQEAQPEPAPSAAQTGSRQEAPEPEAQPAPETPEPPPAGNFQRAENLHEQGRYQEAQAIYRQLAELGDARAQFKMGVMYERGQGVTQDYAQAVFWLLQAAEKGNSHAQYSLAAKYKSGLGAPQDDAQAAYWYRKAAEAAANP